MNIRDHIYQFPHCDQRVLHAPEDNCEYCNAHPEWQALRVAWGIAFTGHSFNPDGSLQVDVHNQVLMPCPAEAVRDIETIHNWHGNIPMTPEASKAFGEFLDQRHKDIAEHLDSDPERA